MWVISLSLPGLRATYAGALCAGPGRAAPPPSSARREQEAPPGRAVHRRVTDSLARLLTNRDIGDRLQSRRVPARPSSPPPPPPEWCGPAPSERERQAEPTIAERGVGGSRPAEVPLRARTEGGGGFAGPCREREGSPPPAGRRERLPLAAPGGVAMAAPGGAGSWGGAGGAPLNTRRRPIALVPGEELTPTPACFSLRHSQ